MYSYIRETEKLVSAEPWNLDLHKLDFLYPSRVYQSTGCPKKIGILSRFEFLYLGGVFLGVKNISKNFGNQKYIGLYSKILNK